MNASGPRAVGALFLIAVLAATVPAVAVAQPYDHTDPMSSGCSSGAYTVATAPVRRKDNNQQVATIELRWSPTCGTNWARLTPSSGVYPVLAVAEAQRPADGAVATYSVRYGSTWPIYTDMLNGSTNCVQASGYITLDGPMSNIPASGATGCY